VANAIVSANIRIAQRALSTAWGQGEPSVTLRHDPQEIDLTTEITRAGRTMKQIRTGTVYPASPCFFSHALAAGHRSSICGFAMQGRRLA
jgi:hypothetical protein